MDWIPPLLRRAREATALSLGLAADLLDIDAEELEALERGTVAADTRVVDRFATVLGLTLEDFLAERFDRASAPLLYRSLEHSAPALEELVASGSQLILGDFLRTLRVMSELEERLGEPRDASSLDALGASRRRLASDAPIAGREFARVLRDELGLGTEPIPSVRELLTERLHVEVVVVAPDLLSRELEGASAINPIPGVLINPVWGTDAYWHSRMSLAHELCHLVLDRDVLCRGSERRLMLSPMTHAGHDTSKQSNERGARGARQRWAQLEDFVAREQRASSFAAYLLAPPAALERLRGGANPRDEGFVADVMATFGVGHHTAAAVISNVFGLTRSEFLALRNNRGRGRRSLARARAFERDRLAVPDTAHPPLMRLLGRALERGVIDRVSAWAILSIRLDEELPDATGLPWELRQPPRPPEREIALRAGFYLASVPAYAALAVGRIRRTDTGWNIAVVDAETSPPHDAGHLIMNERYVVVADHVTVGAHGPRPADG